MEYDKELSLARLAAVEAGEAIMKIYAQETVEITVKEDASPLTEADLASNRIIEQHIRGVFPEDGLLSEESLEVAGTAQKSRCWIVDPLDGTKEFLKHNGEFTVNIALALKGEPVVGVVYVPATEECYYAARGHGAHVERGGTAVSLATSPRTESLRLMVSRSHPSGRLERFLEMHAGRIAETLPAGSSLKGCRVAEGVADIYYRFGPTMEWDTAAMQCVVEEAGGYVAQMDHSALRYNREDHKNHKGFYMVNRRENVLDVPKGDV